MSSGQVHERAQSVGVLGRERLPGREDTDRPRYGFDPAHLRRLRSGKLLRRWYGGRSAVRGRHLGPRWQPRDHVRRQDDLHRRPVRLIGGVHDDQSNLRELRRG